MSSSPVKRTMLKLLLGLTVLITLFVINTWVYPFTSSKPNFSDVERVFNKIQFPNDWEQIDASENSGIAGRRCPIEQESACYHKSHTYKTGGDTEQAEIEAVLKSSGCSAVSFDRSEPIGGVPYVNYECSIEGLSIEGTMREEGGWDASFTVYSG